MEVKHSEQGLYKGSLVKKSIVLEVHQDNAICETEMKVYQSAGVVGTEAVSPHQYHRMTAQKPIDSYVSFWPSIKLLTELKLR